MTLAPLENNLFSWKASIPGPEGSPYEGGVFNLVVELANDYPYVCSFVANGCGWTLISEQLLSAESVIYYTVRRVAILTEPSTQSHHASISYRIYHMNISERGSVCIDILKHNWSPALSLYKVLLSLSSLLTDPNPSEFRPPFNPFIY